MLLLRTCNTHSNRNVLTRHCSAAIAVYSSIINFRSSVSKKYIHSRDLSFRCVEHSRNAKCTYDTHICRR